MQDLTVSLVQLDIFWENPGRNIQHINRILADADLDYLGRDDFFIIGDQLFNELKATNTVNKVSDWDQIQIKFLENHHYFTNTAQTLRGASKGKNLQIIKSKYS